MELNEYIKALPTDRAMTIIAKLNSLNALQRKEYVEELKIEAANYHITPKSYTRNNIQGSPNQHNVQRRPEQFNNQGRPNRNNAQRRPEQNNNQGRPNQNNAQRRPDLNERPDNRNSRQPSKQTAQPSNSVTNQQANKDNLIEEQTNVIQRPNLLANLMKSPDDLRRGSLMSEIFRVPMCKRKKKI